jgi:hypothetical protein
MTGRVRPCPLVVLRKQKELIKKTPDLAIEKLDPVKKAERLAERKHVQEDAHAASAKTDEKVTTDAKSAFTPPPRLFSRRIPCTQQSHFKMRDPQPARGHSIAGTGANQHLPLSMPLSLILMT